MESSFLQTVGATAIGLMMCVGAYLTVFKSSWLKGSFALLTSFGVGSVVGLLKRLDAHESIVAPVFLLVIIGIGFIIAFMALGAQISKALQDKDKRKEKATAS